MFTTTNVPEGPICFMDQHPSLLSPFNFFDVDAYDNNTLNYDESVLLSVGNNHLGEPSDEPVNAYQGDVDGIVEQASRRRSGKGDRHSKIPTARGLRDRRMRLSLDVARKFFKLQDLLSYDKPSQTVKWLLMQAGPAIEELKEGLETRRSCMSYSELGEEAVENTTCGEKARPKGRASSYEKGKRARKDGFDREAKELRKKARERARERTQNKYRRDDPKPFDMIKQLCLNRALVASDDWSQNYCHQEDQDSQFKSVQEFEFHGWEPYYG